MTERELPATTLTAVGNVPRRLARTYSAYIPIDAAGSGEFINNAHATFGTFSGYGHIPEYPICFSSTAVTFNGAFRSRDLQRSLSH